MNSSIANDADATTGGTSETKSSVRVTDKRNASASDAAPAKETDTRYEDNMKVTLEPEVVDPVDALMNKTFDFIISQPEWYAMLQLPRGVRKELGRKFGKLLTTFPHFNKVR